MSLYDKYDVYLVVRDQKIQHLNTLGQSYHWVVLLTNNITDAYYDWAYE